MCNRALQRILAYRRSPFFVIYVALVVKHGFRLEQQATVTTIYVAMVESGIKSCRYGRIWNKIDLMKHCRYSRFLHQVNHVTMVDLMKHCRYGRLLHEVNHVTMVETGINIIMIDNITGEILSFLL